MAMIKIDLPQIFIPLLNGFGQIMLQRSARAGFLFIAGIWAHSWVMALGAVLGALTGSITAYLCRCRPEDIRAGLYGFNGCLVGIALSFFYAPGMGNVLFIATGGALSALVMRRMLNWKKHLPPYTAPFIVVTWALLPVGELFGLNPAVTATLNPAGDGFTVLRGLGQVMFQDYWITGLIFTAGLALHSRQATAWALIGSAVGLIAARSLGFPENLAVAGVFSFNGVLTGIALSDRFQKKCHGAAGRHHLFSGTCTRISAC
ncbi:MAG: urea transporter [Desulfobulbus sp.]|nr:urea transporter [Desulfobulbus sp.]